MKKLLTGVLGGMPGVSFAVSPLSVSPVDHGGPLDVLIDLFSQIPMWFWGVMAVLIVVGALTDKKKK